MEPLEFLSEDYTAEESLAIIRRNIKRIRSDLRDKFFYAAASPDLDLLTWHLFVERYFEDEIKGSHNLN